MRRRRFNGSVFGHQDVATLGAVGAIDDHGSCVDANHIRSRAWQDARLGKDDRLGQLRRPAQLSGQGLLGLAATVICDGHLAVGGRPQLTSAREVALEKRRERDVVVFALGVGRGQPLQLADVHHGDLHHLVGHVLLIPEFCPCGQRLTCGPTLSTNQMRPWD